MINYSHCDGMLASLEVRITLVNAFNLLTPDNTEKTGQQMELCQQCFKMCAFCCEYARDSCVVCFCFHCWVVQTSLFSKFIKYVSVCFNEGVICGEDLIQVSSCSYAHLPKMTETENFLKQPEKYTDSELRHRTKRGKGGFFVLNIH